MPWRECGIGQTDRAECLWRVKQTSGPGSLLGGSSYSFLWEAPRDPGSHKIKIGYEYKAWGDFKQWGYRDTAFEGVDVTVTVPPPRADRGPTKVNGRYGREWNPGVHFVQPDLHLHRLVPRN